MSAPTSTSASGSAPTRREAWQSGPVAGVPALLQPVAHALIQTRDELTALSAGLPDDILWARPAGVASPGFHLRHVSGVVDRLFTYARGDQLSTEQRSALGAEGEAAREGYAGNGEDTAESLAAAFAAQVERALEQLRATDAADLTLAREIGRARLPSTMLGLLSHAAEHTQRHLGQFLVTVRVARSAAAGSGRSGATAGH
ncbi:MAG: DinB family protein [Gemmatimonadaceae bacterium]